MTLNTRKVLRLIFYIPAMTITTSIALMAQVVGFILGMGLMVFGIMTGDMFRDGYDWKIFCIITFGGVYMIVHTHTNYWKD